MRVWLFALAAAVCGCGDIEGHELGGAEQLDAGDGFNLYAGPRCEDAGVGDGGFISLTRDELFYCTRSPFDPKCPIQMILGCYGARLDLPSP